MKPLYSDIRNALASLASSWRAKAERIDMKYSPLVPGQAEVAKAAFVTCAEEVEAIINEMDGGTVSSIPGGMRR